MNKKKEKGFVKVISFTNRKADSLKMLAGAMSFYSNMSITK